MEGRINILTHFSLQERIVLVFEWLLSSVENNRHFELFLFLEVQDQYIIVTTDQ